MRTLAIVLAAALAAGCARTPSEPEGLEGGYVMMLFPEYAPWAAELAACLGEQVGGHALVQEVEWVSADRIPSDKGGDLDGRYSNEGRARIYITRPHLLSKRVVKHELTHHLRWTRHGNGDGAHKGAWWECQWR